MLNLLNEIIQKLERSLWAQLAVLVVVVLSVFSVGFWAGRHQEPPPAKVEIRTVQDTESKQKLVESLKVEQDLRQQIATMEKTISEMKVRVVEKVRIVTQKDGTTVVEKEKITDTETKTDTSKTTTDVKEDKTKVVSDKTTTTDTKTHTDTKTTITPMPKDKFFAGISAGLDLTGVSKPGVEFKYRLFDLGKISVWTGAELISGPPANLLDGQLRVGAGISF